MTKYLTKEEVVQELYKVSHRLSDPPIDKAELETIKELHSIMHKIEQMPTADVVEVKHGEWEEVDSTPKGQMFHCSVCHKTAYFPQPTRDKTWKKQCPYTYCPNCGAKMDGERKQ